MENTFICDRCGQRYAASERFRVGADELCKSCAEAMTLLCDECRTRIYRDDDQGDARHVLCQVCYDRYFTRCDHCGRVIRNECVRYRDWNEDALCEECYDELENSGVIHEYDYVPDLVFHGKGLRHFGVELEIDGGGRSNSKAEELLKVANGEAENLYIKSDGSLDDGLDLVTHPMTLDYHLSEMPWPEILDRARSLGYLSHRATTCGLHIHISRLAFGCTYDQQEQAIARLLYFVEKFWPELLRFSRRTQGQLNRWAARYGMKLCPQEQIVHAKNSDAGRYTAVNLTNSETIEIRIFRGTLKLNTLLATLQLVNHLCDVAVLLSDESLQDMSWYDFLNRVKEPELIAYLKERCLYVNEPVHTEEDD
ncbi:zinc-binding protein [Butyricicoccus faecihominis]|uniref:zinc-binding protein n=1 Tax=Butyricicoccus faecihominis TaxID=1712515 RepID=UPI0024797B8D|nr:zinc-binding protein [Butyricicoccus faecihominis]MCQ5128041.1 zinc-binding protein [Butyricicoccus faecihominis]